MPWGCPDGAVGVPWGCLGGALGVPWGVAGAKLFVCRCKRVCFRFVRQYGDIGGLANAGAKF